MDPVTIWTMSKRYVVGAIVSASFLALGLIGIDAVQNPELVPVIENVADAFGMAVFYIGVILWKTWRQKKKLEAGEVLPERIESAATAREHGTRVG